VEGAVKEGARRAKACEVLGISVRTLQRWEKEPGKEDGRCGPKSRPVHALTEEEKMAVVSVVNSRLYRDMPPSQIVPILADGGRYIASESTIYRILREEKLLVHRSAVRPRRHRRPTEYEATGPNQVWCWDITYLRSAVRGQYYYLYLVVDVWSRKIMGWEVHEGESSELASRLVLKACMEHGVDPKGLVIHSDNGGPMKGATLLATMQWLGIIPSFSRPSVSEDNAYAEALFRTLKYRPEYPTKPFASIEEARGWMSRFVRWYNHEHRHSGIRFVTPASRHTGEEVRILANRRRVYEAARERNPLRWSRGIRNWEPIAKVRLNPSKKDGNKIITVSNKGIGGMRNHDAEKKMRQIS
jgi:putative transposase